MGVDENDATLKFKTYLPRKIALRWWARWGLLGAIWAG